VAKENNEKHHEGQTAFGPQSTLGSSEYQEQLLNTELRRPVFIWYE
jgi:hypothetical protein